MILVDTNVLIDALDGRSRWARWSTEQLGQAAAAGGFINAVIAAELGARFSSLSSLASALEALEMPMIAFDIAAAFRAAEAFRQWIANGGRRGAMLPDLIIGGQAAVLGARILTRDPRRFRRYFPELQLITPEGNHG